VLHCVMVLLLGCTLACKNVPELEVGASGLLLHALYPRRCASAHTVACQLFRTSQDVINFWICMPDVVSAKMA
jgi:hypothetical protein